VETTIDVVEQSQVGQVRRLATDLGRAQGLTEEDIGRAALVATEMSTNLVKYGKSGTVTLSRYHEDGAEGLQLVAADKGPGFPDFAASTRDGHSTGGSLGIGLGVIMRASDLFDTYTRLDQGSAILSRVARDRVGPVVPTDSRLAVGSRQMPKSGEVECGDAWAHASCGRWERLCIVDGLGHGPLAAVAAQEAVAAFRTAPETHMPADIIQACHDALRSTRGAVMAVVAIDRDAGAFHFAGVGNIAGMLYSGISTNHLLSTEGIVGHRMRTVRTVERGWSAGDAVILSTDGLSGRWNASDYPGLLQRHPVLIASILFRDFARATDDATVVVARDLR
jgi:anti-sigma regulatory factor (Ser/Thr protein kinase)